MRTSSVLTQDIVSYVKLGSSWSHHWHDLAVGDLFLCDQQICVVIDPAARSFYSLTLQCTARSNTHAFFLQIMERE